MARLYLIKLKTVLHSNKFLSLLIGSLIIYLLIFFNLIPHQSQINANKKSIKGTLISEKIDGNKLSLIIKTPEKISATYYIKTKESKEKIEKNLKLGMEIMVVGKLVKPSKNTIPNTFNYQKYLYHNKIYYLMNAQDIKIINNRPNLVYRLKNFLIDKIKKRENKEYYYAFILGDKNYIKEQTWQNYQDSGITHLFAISGMHIALFISLISKLFRLFRINSTFKNIFIFGFLTFYLLLTNFTASILRACMFLLFRKLNKNLNIDLPNIKVLIYTLILLLFLNPYLLFNLGFLYSALATFSLIIGNKIIQSKNYFFAIIKTSLLINIITLPLTLFNFYEINILSFLFNCLFIPLVTFVIYPLILLNFVIPLFTLSCSFFLLVMEKMAFLCANVSFKLSFPKINLLFILIYYLSLFALWHYKDVKVVIFLGLFLLFWQFKPYFDATFYVYFLDVGQGDSILIKNPFSKEVILVDTGGKIDYPKEQWEEQNHNYHLSDNTIVLLKSLGITKIDWLILSHGDADHMQESINLVKNFKIKNVIFNNDTYKSIEKQLIKLLDKKKIDYYQNIQKINISPNTFYFLNFKIYDNENDNSNIIYFNYDNYKFLLMGDASIKVEEDLLNKYNLSNIDVLKVGHHGSKTSTSKNFIDKIKPKYSIISVGKNNRYNHPNKEALDNLQKSQIYRTDIDGSIIFKIHKHKLEIETCPS